MSIFALVMLMLLPGLSPAGVWEEYIYLDRGVAIQFPAKPEASMVPYASALVKGLLSTIYTAQDDNVVFKLTIVDVAGHIDAAANLLNEANYSLRHQRGSCPLSSRAMPIARRNLLQRTTSLRCRLHS